MKKSLFKGAVLSAFAGLSVIGLASCGGNVTTSSATTTDDTDNEPEVVEGVHSDKNLDLSKVYNSAELNATNKEIVFHHTMGDTLQNVLNTAITKFEQTYPGWKITATQIGGYDDVKNQCIAELSAGAQPDLAYCYADHVAQYMRTGKVVDMSAYINATGTIDGRKIGYTSEEISDFVPGYYNEGKATNFANYAGYGYKKDAMLTLPYVKSTEVMYYNKTALDELGLKVPTTWDELWEECQYIIGLESNPTWKDKYGSCTPLGYDSEANWIINMCQQNGWGYTSADGDHFRFNNPELANWLNSLTEKKNDFYFTTQQIYGSYTSALFTAGPAAGGSIFSIGSSGGASHQATDSFTWGVAPIPGSKKSDGTVDASVISQGPSLVMFQNENDTEVKSLLTWEFVKMLEDPAYQASFSMVSGYNPTRQSTFKVEDYKDFLSDDTNIAAVTAGVAAQLTDRFFTSPAFSGSSMARTQMQSVFCKVVQGQATAEKALEDAYKKCSGK